MVKLQKGESGKIPQRKDIRIARMATSIPKCSSLLVNELANPKGHACV